MLIECGKCGAPLDVREGATIATCNYCRSSNSVRTTRTIAERTPEGWKPPPKWTPPSTADLPQEELAYRTQWRAPLVMVTAATLLLGGIGAAVSLTASEASETGSGLASTPRAPVSALATLDTAITPAALVEHFGPSATAVSDIVRVDLESDRWTTMTFSWNEERDHLTHVDLRREGPSPALDAMRRAITARFGLRAADQQTSGLSATAAGGGNIYVNEDGSSAYVQARPEQLEGRDFRAQMRVLWDVFRADVIGLDVDVADADRPLLVGYPPARIAEIDPNVPVDGALAHVRSLVPAVTSSQTVDLQMQIPMDHPWLGLVDVDWHNEANGQLYSVQLWRVDRADLHSQEEIAACFHALLGEPEISVVDHLQHRRNFSWGYFAGPEHTLMSPNQIRFGIPPGEPGRERFRAIFTTLAGCGTAN